MHQHRPSAPQAAGSIARGGPLAAIHWAAVRTRITRTTPIAGTPRTATEIATAPAHTATTAISRLARMDTGPTTATAWDPEVDTAPPGVGTPTAVTGLTREVTDQL